MPDSIGEDHGGVISAAVVNDRLEMFLANTMDALDAGRLVVEDYLRPHSLDALALNRVEVAFEEVVSNIIRHGFQAQADQVILVTVAAGPKQIELTFEDDGLPFDPLSISLREGRRSLETTEIGGLGLPLIRKLSARVTYGRVDTPKRQVGNRTFKPVNRLNLWISK